MARLPAARRRAQLLDVALELFASKGYHQASMHEIAEAAGVTKPVLYQHFASKEELYLELLRDVSTRLNQAVSEATASAAGPREQVENGFRAFFRFVADKPARFGILFAEATRRIPEFHTEVARIERTISSNIASLIVVEGMDDEHRQLLAYGIVGMAEVTCRQWTEGGVDVDDSDALAAQVAELAWTGLRGVRQV
ncbi:MAG: TetR/AcrR family transcriptional regulator [Acidimicrobiia bacterium]|nr:TetR/AcrR family transcriptional regulator [Acidimicrobiia bacterium]